MYTGQVSLMLPMPYRVAIPTCTSASSSQCSAGKMPVVSSAGWPGEAGLAADGEVGDLGDLGDLGDFGEAAAGAGEGDFLSEAILTRELNLQDEGNKKTICCVHKKKKTPPRCCSFGDRNRSREEGTCGGESRWASQSIRAFQGINCLWLCMSWTFQVVAFTPQSGPTVRCLTDRPWHSCPTRSRRLGRQGCVRQARGAAPGKAEIRARPTLPAQATPPCNLQFVVTQSSSFLGIFRPARAGEGREP